MSEYYYSLNRYLRETFGEKVYKLALDAGCTCPNRDGTLGYTTYSISLLATCLKNFLWSL